ncbi:MAG: phospholipase D-like domain-containing protein [Acidimicrobiales bacterium]
MVAAIQAASFVEVEVYELGNPAVVAALIAAQNRGVPPGRNPGRPRRRRPREAARDQPGVITGGVNLGAYSGDTTDMDLSLPASDVAPAKRIFAADWVAATSATPPTSGGLSSGHAVPFVTGPAIQTARLTLFAHASGRCVVLADYLTDYAVRDAIRRGDPPWRRHQRDPTRPPTVSPRPKWPSPTPGQRLSLPLPLPTSTRRWLPAEAPPSSGPPTSPTMAWPSFTSSTWR